MHLSIAICTCLSQYVPVYHNMYLSIAIYTCLSQYAPVYRNMHLSQKYCSPDHHTMRIEETTTPATEVHWLSVDFADDKLKRVVCMFMTSLKDKSREADNCDCAKRKHHSSDEWRYVKMLWHLTRRGGCRIGDSWGFSRINWQCWNNIFCCRCLVR